MNPIWCRMKKHSPSNGQNDQLVHWWLLVHSGCDLGWGSMLQNGQMLLVRVCVISTS